MKKSLYVFGGLIILFVAFDLTSRAGALAQVVTDVMSFTSGDPAPESVSLVAYVALHMMIVALGLALVCVGPLRQSEDWSMTAGGRKLHALAGLGVVAMAVICFLAVYSVRTAFNNFPAAVEGGNFEQTLANIKAVVQSASDSMRSGFMILGGAGGLLSLAAIVGLKRIPPHEDEAARQPMRGRIQMVAVLAAVGLASEMFLIIPHVGTLRSFYGDPEMAPKLRDLAAELLGIMNKSLISFGLVGLIGLLQIATAYYSPRLGEAEAYDDDEGYGDEEYDEAYDGETADSTDPKLSTDEKDA